MKVQGGKTKRKIAKIEALRKPRRKAPWQWIGQSNPQKFEATPS